MASTMRLGVVIRVMGAASQPQLLRECAQAADRAGIDDLWVVDHIAIPPDESEGSDGRYLDPLATLAYLAAATERIGLGTSVLVLPYRPPLPTAKTLATIQELSGGRLQLGVGVGWMKAEFQALGVPREERGQRTDRVLDTLRRCFDAPDDIVFENEQAFLFRPKPPRPPIFVGGGPPHALERAVRYGDGWMPMSADPEKLAPQVQELRKLAEAAGAPTPEVVTMGGLPADASAAAARLNALEAIGVTRFLTGALYGADDTPFRKGVDALVRAREALGTPG
jgi:probable F420-dependent oxidoreductase